MVVCLCVAFPFFLIGILLFRAWLYGNAGWGKPDGNLFDPDDFTLTKLRLDARSSPTQISDDRQDEG